MELCKRERRPCDVRLGSFTAYLAKAETPVCPLLVR